MSDGKSNIKAHAVAAQVDDPNATEFYTSKERLHLTEDGRAVGAEDPEGVCLLVPAGGKLPLSLARQLGFVVSEDDERQSADDGLDKLKKADLVAIAQEKGIDGAAAMTKADLVASVSDAASAEG